MTVSHTNIKLLRQHLIKKPDLPVKFSYDGVAINQGYHITEVKFASIKSIDCGRSSTLEEWNEIVVQLLDGSSQSKQGHMSAAKFLGIIDAALIALSEEPTAYLYVEYGPNNGPLHKLSITSMQTSEHEVLITLGSEQAVCKPFQRLMAARHNPLPHTVNITQPTNEGCCTTATEGIGRSCCG